MRILLIDDHDVVRAGLRAILGTQSDIEVVGEAANGADGVRQALALQPDVVLMDLAIGAGMDGIEATRRITADAPGIRILVFTTYDSDADIVRVIDAGATGYLLKDSTPEELYAAIRAAAQGQAALSAPVASVLLKRMQQPEGALTPREAEILELLAAGLSNRELGRKLYVSETTVKTHLLHIYRKLGVETRSAAIAEAGRRGWVRHRP
ncbi:response regulator transcription factor [Arthrobacter sp.]|uniref:response regulator transcription factor n=1 Tax=Arthrobacter sp. TaxID=1667 RepID=UPI002811D0EE|nr:response regulator transcription factor [Arthrobacter sp.]